MLAGVLVFTAFSVRVHANAIAYSVTDLGTLGGGSSNAYGINSSGQVAGAAHTSGGQYHAVRWTGATPEDLGTAGGSESYGYGINDAGQVAGYARFDLGYPGAVRWTDTTAEVIGINPGSIIQGFAINASGQVAGIFQGPGVFGSFHATLWTEATPTDLHRGFGTSYAFGINAYGEVVGFYNGGPAVRWTSTTQTVLASLGGSAWAYGINDSGQVVGSSQVSGPTVHAVLWNGITPTDLGTLGNDSRAFAINALGDVVGMSQTLNNASYDAFLYTGGIMYNLNSLLLPGHGVTGLTISDRGNSINDSGQIAASGTINGQTHALRLDPVPSPEPGSAVLLLGGVVLLALRRRRAV